MLQILLWPTVWALLIIVATSIHIRRHRAAILVHQQALNVKYKKTRGERLQWKKNREGFFDFSHPEYQILWRAEIDTESTFMKALPKGLAVFQNWLSWKEYDLEKKLAEKSL